MAQVWGFKRVKIILILIGCALALGLAACKFPVDFVQMPGGVLFQDDFSEASSGWRTEASGQSTLEYVNGEYRMAVREAHTRVWSTPNLYFQDVRLEVDTRKDAGDDRNVFGLICRYRDAGHFYALLASSDGYFGIFKTAGGEITQLGRDSMAATDALQTGNQPNHLRADCIGNQLTLYANGRLLDSQRDGEFMDGDVGLLVGLLEGEATEITFDNLSVIKP